MSHFNPMFLNPSNSCPFSRKSPFIFFFKNSSKVQSLSNFQSNFFQAFSSISFWIYFSQFWTFFRRIFLSPKSEIFLSHKFQNYFESRGQKIFELKINLNMKLKILNVIWKVEYRYIEARCAMLAPKNSERVRNIRPEFIPLQKEG